MLYCRLTLRQLRWRHKRKLNAIPNDCMYFNRIQTRNTTTEQRPNKQKKCAWTKWYRMDLLVCRTAMRMRCSLVSVFMLCGNDRVRYTCPKHRQCVGFRFVCSNRISLQQSVKYYVQTSYCCTLNGFWTGNCWQLNQQPLDRILFGNFPRNYSVTKAR